MTTPPRQPTAFYLMVAVSAWERFVYYGFRSILFAFLAERLHVSDASSSSSDFVRATIAPLFGAYVADRFLGHRKAIIAGALLMALGAALMTVELVAIEGIGLFLLGSGLIRPTSLALLGDAYRRGDPRRDAGFALNHAAICAAGLTAPALASALGVFNASDAALGFMAGTMLLGAGAFVVAQRHLAADGYPGSEDSAPRARSGPHDVRDIGLTMAVLGVLVFAAVALWPALETAWSGLSGMGRGLGVLVLVLGFAGVERLRRREGARPLDVAARQRLGVLAIVVVAGALWWVGADVQFDMHWRFLSTSPGGVTDGSWLLTLSGVAPLVAALLFAALWRRRDATPPARSSLPKLGAGLLIVGVGTALSIGADAGAVPLVVLATVAAAVGEACLVPVATSLVSKLAPERSLALCMAAFLIVPQLLTSMLRSVSTNLEDPGTWTGQLLTATALCIAAGVTLIAATPALQRRMHGAEEPEAAAVGTDPYRSGGAGSGLIAPAPSAQAVASGQMLRGALWTLGGLLTTAASYNAASAGGSYVVAYGAIIYGVVTFVRGALSSGRSASD